MKKRILWIDRLKGIAFIFVIIGHLSIGKVFKSWIYSFHMPLFFFISGFTLNIDKIYQTKFTAYLKKNIMRLLIPYCWLYLILLPITYIRIRFVLGNSFSLKKHIIGMFVCNRFMGYPMTAVPLYFLIVLFLSQLLIWVIVKIAKGNFKGILALSVLILPISLCTTNINLPWHINSVPANVFMIFTGRILMDFYLSRKEFFESKSQLKHFSIIVVLFALGFLLWKYNGRISVPGVSYGEDFVLCILSAASTGFALAMIAMKMPKSKIFNFIGRNTLFYIGAHSAVVKMLNALFPKYEKLPPFIIAATIFTALSLIPITILIQKFQPYIAGIPIKKKTLPIEIGKYVAVFAVTIIPFIFTIKKFFNGVFYSNTALLVLSTLLYLGLCVLVTLVMNKFIPILFLQEKPTDKQKEKTLQN